MTNVPDSPLEQAAALSVRCAAGEERAVAATKSYVAELAAVAGIVAALVPESEMAAALPRVPDVLDAALAAAEAWLVATTAGSSPRHRLFWLGAGRKSRG